MLSGISRVVPPLSRGLTLPVLWMVLFSLSAPLAAQTALNSQTSSIRDLKVAPDLDARLARFKPIPMPFHQQGLSPREIQLVHKLVAAANYIEQIYWRQSDPDGLKLYLSLAGSTNPQDVQLRHFLKINGSRYDLSDEMKPFVGTDPAPPGRALYPPGLTRDDIEKYVQQHPEQKAGISEEFTVVRRKGDALVAIPYHVEYAEFLKPAATALRDAASLSDDPGFAKFLR